MYFQFACPSCQKNLKVREEHAGSRVRCPYCHTTLTVKAPATPATEEVSGKSIHTEAPVEANFDSPWFAASGTDVNMLRSGMIGLVATACFYAFVIPYRDLLGYFGVLFVERGWVQYAIVFLTSWSFAILVLKSRKLARQKESLLFDLLPNEVSDDITVRTSALFMQHIHALPTNPYESFLINRVLRGLEHFSVLESNSEVAGRLGSQSEIDATAVESSYTAVKVFVWAIPILGFIGTVIGIGAAVAGFSGQLGQSNDINALKQSLNEVTDGLAVAFDTTLLALVMSLLVMFPMSSLQKSEEDLLNLVDEYCNENLLKRLKDGSRAAGNTAVDNARSLQKAVDAAMVEHHAELKIWTKKLESIGAALTDQVVKGWGSVDGLLQQRQKQSLDQVQQALGGLIERQQLVVQKLEQIQSDQGQKFEKILAGSNEEARAMAQRADERQAAPRKS